MKKRKTRKPSAKEKITPKSEVSILKIAFLVLSLILTYVLVIKGLEYDKKIFTWSFIALFIGLLLECFFVFRNLNSIINCFSISFLVSLIIFLPGKREKAYNLQSHLELWPYYFLISFIIGVIIVKQKQVTIKQTEGTTLLQSLAFIYWLMGINLSINLTIVNIFLFIITISATLFSIINSLTKFNLGKTNRLFLSIWSSLILMCLSIDNVFKVFGNGDIDQQNSFFESLKIAVQYFFVGISAVYIVQNILMLLAFLPEKNTTYKQTLITAKKMHLDRYSDLQVSVIDSIYCIIYCTFFFFLNIIYQLLPNNTMIWIVIFTFPFFLTLRKWLERKITANNAFMQ